MKCKTCKRPYSEQEWAKIVLARREKKSRNLKAAFVESKKAGVRIGRPPLAIFGRVALLRKEGKSINAIARVLNCSRTAVEYAIRKGRQE